MFSCENLIYTPHLNIVVAWQWCMQHAKLGTASPAAISSLSQKKLSHKKQNYNCLFFFFFLIIYKATFLRIPDKSFICLAYSPSVHTATEHTAPRRPALRAGLWVPEARRGPAGRGRPLWGSRTRGQTGDSPCPGHRRVVGKRSRNVTGDRCARKAAAEPKQGTDGVITAEMPPRGDASPLPAAGTSAPTRTRRGRAACGALPQRSHAELRFLPESPSSLPLCPLPSPPPAAGQQPLAVPCP